jgi:hypothetical protein
MQNTEEHDFTGQLKYEHYQFFFRHHWVKFLHPFFLMLPVFLLIFIILLGLGRLALMVNLMFIRVFYVIFAIIVIIIFLTIFFLQVMNFYFDLVIVTDCRILIARKTVFLKNNSDAIDLTKIQDIAVEAHGILRNYLRYGKLVITLSTSAPPVTINYVPDPHFYLEWTNRVKREHILQRQEKKKPDAESITQKKEDYLQDIRDLPTS